MKVGALFFFIFGFFIFILSGVLHEKVHVIIFEHYDIESHVEYFSHFPDFVTIADEPCKEKTCLLAHEINEAVGYPLMLLIVLLFIGLFIIILNQEERNRR